jgi:hypothetical protein
MGALAVCIAMAQPVGCAGGANDEVIRAGELAESAEIDGYRLERAGEGDTKLAVYLREGEAEVFIDVGPTEHVAEIVDDDGHRLRLVGRSTGPDWQTWSATIERDDGARVELEGEDREIVTSMPDWLLEDPAFGVLAATLADHNTWWDAGDEETFRADPVDIALLAAYMTYVIWCIARCDRCTDTCNAGNCDQNACNDCVNKC